MKRLFRILIWLMWLALPLTALRFWLVWDQLPARMATHFDFNWRPNGWMPKLLALEFGLGITLLMLVVFTAILIMMDRTRTARIVSWAFLAFSYLIVGFLFMVNSKVVSYNLGQSSASTDWVVLIPLAVIGFTAVYLLASPREPLPPASVLAEEAHGTALLAVIAISASLAFLIIAVAAPAGAARIAIFLAVFLLALIGVAAWSGFHYVFTPQGLEIKTLGFRLRSIPTDQIQNYSIGSWNIFRGYGIRGVGDFRAYVWGNSGVQMSTSQGQIFLGHSDPERIVRDLDMITQNRKGHQVSPA
jgi:hypothetical protein